MSTTSIVGGLRRWLRSRRIERELGSLTDQQLKDIGVTRYDIPRVARYGQFGR